MSTSLLAKAQAAARNSIGKEFGIRRKLTPTTNKLIMGTIVECEVSHTKRARTRTYYVFRMVLENKAGNRTQVFTRDLPR